MIRLFLLLLVVAAGMIAGPLLEGHQGYILIAFGHYTIEMSVVGGVTALVVIYILVQLLSALIKQLWQVFPGLRYGMKNRKQAIARKQTQEGLLSLYQGDYENAHQQLAKSAKSSDSPSLNYLSAARAAANQGELKLSDKLLAKADKKSGDSQTRQAVWLARAKLKLESGDIEATRQLLEQLPSNQQHRPSAMQIHYQLAKADHDWDKQLELLEHLSKFQPERWQEELEYSYRGKFNQLASASEGEFESFWHNLSRKLKQQSWLLRAVLPALLKLQRTDLITSLLKKQIKQKDPTSLSILPRLPKEQATQFISQLESLSKNDPQNTTLLTVLGAIYILNSQLDPASEALKKSQEISPSARNCKLLGDISAARHESEQALSWYQQAFQLRTTETSN
ncbi:heme biosynthesis HemY N-terminal domain-containing protein [Celerinatantimonas diazotrophica]|uniref:Heme biosynthesis-associated TPR repeat protein n=1 Tax=Celerinatantimonas diazotrophica TaxID=412034 RepID=A0A4R1KF22_9GAMM|nr:heme biosynthesis HemY N-terminal domain-containing protein [Celerinatantimonas diazotrophica]TCK63338.1 heme biosynthesis-associated TPR repeat protein [Celerinatantimonas diazotrophica]CAG9298482.1 Protein HemY [Celerinatantimonas diazotrophica]